MKKKFKHITFDFDWVHIRLSNKKAIIEELAELVYLTYKMLGLILGIYMVTSGTWLLFIPIIFWLMFDLRLEKEEV